MSLKDGNSSQQSALVADYLTGEPIFMAGITDYKLYAQQEVETGFVIVTQDCEGGMVDIHDRRPVVWSPKTHGADDLETPVEEAAHCPVKVAADRRIHLVEGGQGR